jgi:hypothetical protein
MPQGVWFDKKRLAKIHRHDLYRREMIAFVGW